MDGEFAGQPFHVGVGHLSGDAVHAQAGDFAAHVNDAVIHGIAEVFAGVAEDDEAAALHHEAAEGAGAAADDDGAAFHVDAGAAAGVAPAHQVAAAHGGAESGAGVLFHHRGAGHHVLGEGPADAAADGDVGAVVESAAEIAEGTGEGQIQPVENADSEGMFGARIGDGDGADSVGHEFTDADVDRARVHAGGVDLGAAVEVHLKSAGVGEGGAVLTQVGVEKNLLVAAAEALAGEVVAQLCHTRTSPS